MIYVLNFSQRIDGNLIPVTENGSEVTLSIEADTKTAAIYHEDTVKFCNENSCTVRQVT